jgi:hypothetical protein
MERLSNNQIFQYNGSPITAMTFYQQNKQTS